MIRRSDSHKGENGKVAVIGGSRFIHGAPIFSALAAEKSGVDLVFLKVPSCHEEVAKHASLNFQVLPFHNDDLSEKDVRDCLELLATIDAAVIGPGIAKTQESISAIEQIVEGASCPLVLDATALQPSILKKLTGTNAVLTPHRGELERLEISEKDLPHICTEYGITIVLKDEVDIITGSDGSQKKITGGNAGLTVGGTGDALAGLLCGLLSQGILPVEAATISCTLLKRAGTLLRTQDGFAYGTSKVIAYIPQLLNTFFPEGVASEKI